MKCGHQQLIGGNLTLNGKTSYAPTGLVALYVHPTAYAVGSIITPLRGFGIY
jgi:hypothetical protein